MFGAELDGAGFESKKGVVTTNADAGARMIFGAALANDDGTGVDFLATEGFDTKAFSRSGGTLSGLAAGFGFTHGEGVMSKK